jgi:hypothetical protein
VKKRVVKKIGYFFCFSLLFYEFSLETFSSHPLNDPIIQCDLYWRLGTVRERKQVTLLFVDDDFRIALPPNRVGSPFAHAFLRLSRKNCVRHLHEKNRPGSIASDYL